MTYKIRSRRLQLSLAESKLAAKKSYGELRTKAGELLATIEQSVDMLDADTEHAGSSSINWADVGSMQDAVKHLAIAAHMLGAIDEDQVSEITGEPY